jgi:subtilase family serine protease
MLSKLPHLFKQPSAALSVVLMSLVVVATFLAQDAADATTSALPGAAALAVTPKISVQKVCTSGFFRCDALLRTDLPVIANAEAAHDGLTPANLRSAYKLPATGGKGRTIAIVDAYDDPNAEADLNVYRSYYHLGACTTANGCFEKVNQDGKTTGLPRPDPLWALEESLDLDMASAICPQCKILLVEASSADETSTTNDKGSDLPHAVATAATFPGVVAISNSYGSVGVEPDETASEDFEYNHPGIAVTVSSGDSGYGAAYPAASQYVVAVGGTTLTADKSTRGWSETAWGSPVADTSIPEVFGATGSGCSMWEPKPSWQTDKGCTKRTEADVSAVADPETGVAVYDSYPADGTPITGWQVVGGTSASSPIVAGIYALAGNTGVTSSTSTSARYPASRLYHRTSSLFDVVTGQNFPVPSACTGGAYVCQAGPGFDGPTGNGTPNGLGAFKP